MKFSESIHINAPVEQVFRAWTDVENYPEWADPVIQRTKLTDGPVVVGTHFACVDKWPGRQVSFEMEITEYDPNKRFGASWSKPMEGSWTSSFSEANEGTLMEFKIEMKPPFIMRLFAPIMRRYAVKQNKQFMQTFKQMLEEKNE